MNNMEITKAVMTTDGPNLRLSVPIHKVDQENRTVSGFATLDNIDQHGDVVTAEASQKAFARFRGNLREMHAPIAVGKVLSFTEEEFYDSLTEKFYRGIFVTAYVSKGAADTWEKVLDGTLAGFSIGGKVLEDEQRYDKSVDAAVRHILDYELLELSLVDNPANQLANVFSIVKAADGSMTVKGMAVDVRLENILWCATDQIAITTSRDNADCAQCSTPLKNIGWVESNASDKAEKIRDSVAKARGMNAGTITTGSINANVIKGYSFSPTNLNTSSTNGMGYTINITLPHAPAETVAKQVSDEQENTLEGGVDEMPEETKETEVATEDATVTVTETTEAPNEEVAPTEEAPAEESVEKAAEVDEVVAEEVDFTKMFNDFAAEVKSVIVSTKEETAELVKGLQSEIATVVADLNTKVSDLQEQVGAVKSTTETVAKRVDSVEDDTAIKKSADLGGSSEKVEKTESLWGGRFLTTDQIVS